MYIQQSLIEILTSRYGRELKFGLQIACGKRRQYVASPAKFVMSNLHNRNHFQKKVTYQIDGVINLIHMSVGIPSVSFNFM